MSSLHSRPLAGLGLATGLVVVYLLASACSGSGPESSSSQPSGEHRTGHRTPAPEHSAPADQHEKIAKDHLAGQTGFTIRHLEDGHVKEIDVPDFKR